MAPTTGADGPRGIVAPGVETAGEGCGATAGRTGAAGGPTGGAGGVPGAGDSRDAEEPEGAGGRTGGRTIGGAIGAAAAGLGDAGAEAAGRVGAMNGRGPAGPAGRLTDAGLDGFGIAVGTAALGATTSAAAGGAITAAAGTVETVVALGATSGVATTGCRVCTGAEGEDGLDAAKSSATDSAGPMSMTLEHTEHRALTPWVGTLDGSIRNVVRQLAQVIFTCFLHRGWEA